MAPSVNFEKAPVKVLVGPDHTVFHIHSSTLTSSSEFFKSALKDNCVEGHQCEITIEWVQPSTFKIYLLWFYSGRQLQEDYLQLAQLYALGEKLIDPTFQDHIVNTFIVKAMRHLIATFHAYIPSHEVVSTIFNSTPICSPARRLMIDLYQMYEGDISDLEPGFETIHVEFLVDGYNESHRDERAGFTDNMHLIDKIKTACAYHKHADDTKCGLEVLAKVHLELN